MTKQRSSTVNLKIITCSGTTLRWQPLNTINQLLTAANLASSRVASERAAQGVQEVMYHGEKIEVKVMSQGFSASAAEEIGAAFSERMERPLASFKKKGAYEGRRVEKPEAFAWLERHEHFKEEALQILQQVFRKRPRNPDEFLKEFKNLRISEHMRFLALLALVEQQGQGKSRYFSEIAATEEFKRKLWALLGELWKKKGSLIRAALNINDTAQVYLDSLNFGSPEELTQLYCDAVLDYGGIKETYRKIADQFGLSSLAQGIRFLLNALGADLRSEDSSIDRNKLKMIIDDMYQLKALTTVLEESERLWRVLSMVPQRFFEQALDLTLDLVLGMHRYSWIVSEKITQLLKVLGMAGLAGEIRLLYDIRLMVTKIPLKIFPDEDTRRLVLETLQEILDEKIMTEEDQA